MRLAGAESRRPLARFLDADPHAVLVACWHTVVARVVDALSAFAMQIRDACAHAVERVAVADAVGAARAAVGRIVETDFALCAFESQEAAALCSLYVRFACPGAIGAARVGIATVIGHVDAVLASGTDEPQVAAAVRDHVWLARACAVGAARVGIATVIGHVDAVFATRTLESQEAAALCGFVVRLAHARAIGAASIGIATVIGHVHTVFATSALASHEAAALGRSDAEPDTVFRSCGFTVIARVVDADFAACAFEPSDSAARLGAAIDVFVLAEVVADTVSVEAVRQTKVTFGVERHVFTECGTQCWVVVRGGELTSRRRCGVARASGEGDE